MSISTMKNRLLASLSPEEFEPLLPLLKRQPFSDKETLIAADRPIENIYFPEVGVFSVVIEAEGGGVIEVATIGSEGFVGTQVLLETNCTAATVFCQVPGSALRISTGDFRAAIDANGSLRRVLLRYTQALMMQMAHAATCNRLHNVEERAARWLLMTRDRVDSDSFPLTQEFLGQMLGVRRQGVNVAAAMLQQAGLIAYSRGVITILDRAGLEGASCECYEMIRREHERLLGE